MSLNISPVPILSPIYESTHFYVHFFHHTCIMNNNTSLGYNMKDHQYVLSFGVEHDMPVEMNKTITDSPVKSAPL